MYICSLSSPLELPGRWTRVRQDPPYWHMPDPRRIILSDQHPWIFTCSTISYEVPPWFLLLGRIVDKMWDLSPTQGPKFLLTHIYHNYLFSAFHKKILFYTTNCAIEQAISQRGKFWIGTFRRDSWRSMQRKKCLIILVMLDDLLNTNLWIQRCNVIKYLLY